MFAGIPEKGFNGKGFCSSDRPTDPKLEKVLIEENSSITIPLPNIRVYFKCDNKASFKKRINEKLLRRAAKKGREG